VLQGSLQARDLIYSWNDRPILPTFVQRTSDICATQHAINKIQKGYARFQNGTLIIGLGRKDQYLTMWCHPRLSRLAKDRAASARISVMTGRTAVSEAALSNFEPASLPALVAMQTVTPTFCLRRNRAGMLRQAPGRDSMSLPRDGAGWSF